MVKAWPIRELHLTFRQEMKTFKLIMTWGKISGHHFCNSIENSTVLSVYCSYIHTIWQLMSYLASFPCSRMGMRLCHTQAFSFQHLSLQFWCGVKFADNKRWEDEKATHHQLVASFSTWWSWTQLPPSLRLLWCYHCHHKSRLFEVWIDLSCSSQRRGTAGPLPHQLQCLCSPWHAG